MAAVFLDRLDYAFEGGEGFGAFLVLCKEPRLLLLGFVAAGSLLVSAVPMKFGASSMERMEF